MVARLLAAGRGLADFEPGRALELALGQLRWELRVDAALTQFAEIARAHADPQPARGVDAIARLFDEQRPDGAFAFARWQRGAIARGVDAETCGHGGAEEIGVGAFPQLGLDQVVA